MPVNINLLPDEVIARGITPPDVGQGLSAFQTGQDYAQKQYLQNLFRDGLPRTPDGGVDWYKASEMALQAQGAPGLAGAESVAKFGLLQRLIKNRQPGAANPGLPPQPDQPTPGPQSALPDEPSPTSLSRGGATAPSLAAARTYDTPQNLGQVTGVDRGPIEGNQNLFQTTAFVPEQPASFPDRFTGGDEAAIPPNARPQQYVQNQQRPQVPTGDVGQVPGQSNISGGLEISERNAQRFEKAAKENFDYGEALDLYQPGAGSAAKARAQTLMNQVDIIRKGLVEKSAPTTDIKNYQVGRLPGETLPQYQARTAGEGEQAKKLAEQFAKKYESIQEAGGKAETAIPQLQIVQRSTADPNFYSGFAANRVLLAKQVIGALGGDPNTAAPMQVSESLLSGSILSGLKAIVQGTGQIRSAELGLMRNQAAAPTDSPEAFRTKVEVAMRVQQRARQIADMAQGYKGGNLDAGFDKQVSQLPPLFSPNELKNPKLLAYQKFNSPVEAANSGLPPNTKFRDSNDVIRFMR